MSCSPRAHNLTGSFRALSFPLLRCNEHWHEVSCNGFHTEESLCPKSLWLFTRCWTFDIFQPYRFSVFIFFWFFRPKFTAKFTFSARARVFHSISGQGSEKLIKQRSRSLLFGFFFLRDLSYVLLTRAFSLQLSGVDLRLPVFFCFFLSCVSASVCVAPSFTLLFRQIYGGKYMFCFFFQVGHCFCLFGGS